MADRLQVQESERGCDCPPEACLCAFAEGFNALQVRLRAERDRYREELREAHTWLLAAEMCDCEHFPGAGTKLCRFAEALDG